jgi:hypothetical protein
MRDTPAAFWGFGQQPREHERRYRARGGETNYVRVQVLTPVGVLDRDKQLGVVNELTEIVAAAFEIAAESISCTKAAVLFANSGRSGTCSHRMTAAARSRASVWRSGNVPVPA